MDPFARLAQSLLRHNARYVVIGVFGANFHAPGVAALFSTRDCDLLLPPDPANMLRAWHACRECGFSLWCGDEPLGEPMDEFLARRIVERRALVRAEAPRVLEVDLTLVMAGFDFDTVWSDRRTFELEGVPVPVARISHIVRSKAAAGRDKDKLFLAAHADALRALLQADGGARPREPDSGEDP